MHPNSPDVVTEDIKDLATRLNTIIAETNSQLRSINAFGNSQVMANLTVSAGKIIEILQGAVKQVESSANKQIAEAAQAYIKTGSSATEAANIRSE